MYNLYELFHMYLPFYVFIIRGCIYYIIYVIYH